VSPHVWDTGRGHRGVSTGVARLWGAGVVTGGKALSQELKLWDATLSMGNGHSACANRIRRAARAYIITEELQRSGQRGSTGDSMEHTHGATGSEEKQGWSGRGRIGHGTASSVGGSGCTEMSRGGPGGMVHESCHRRGRHGSGLPRGQGLGWAQRVVGCRRVRLDAGPVWDIAKDHVLGHKGEEGPGEQSFEIEGD
jgi:hypothetical protein